MAYIGIDLGTTNTLAAYKEYKKKVRVLTIQYTEPQRDFIPSVVAVASQKGQYLTGWEAFDVSGDGDGETVFSIKRLMGRAYNDKDEKEGRFIRDLAKERWGYEILSGSTEEEILVRLGGIEHSPQEISAYILRRIKEVAEAQLGEGVEGAVITVPAYFTEKQCAATREAAQKAGINVQKITDEPTAAARALSIADLEMKRKRVLVYDLGGGTFDVSFGTMIGPRFRARAIDGDNWLGGDDFDKKVVDYVLSEIEQRGGVPPKDNQFMFELQNRARKAKEVLSEETETEIGLEDFSIPGIRDVLKVPLTRKQFEDMIEDDIDETIRLVESVLNSKGVKPEKIDAVLLVGGSTKIPMVRRKMEKIFGPDKIVTSQDPMLCVAFGAAIESYDLIGKIECPWCNTENERSRHKCKECGKLLPDLNPPCPPDRPYGVEVYDEERGRYEFDVIIPKNKLYPLKSPAKRSYLISADNARLLKVRFFAGKKYNDMAYNPNPEGNELMGTLWMVLPAGLKKGDSVDVSLNRVDKIMRASVQCGQKKVDSCISRGSKSEQLANRIEEQIHFIEELERDDNSRDSSVPAPLAGEKNILMYSYFVMSNYKWLLKRLYSPEQLEEIDKTREALENAIEKAEQKVERKPELKMQKKDKERVIDTACSAMELLIESAGITDEREKAKKIEEVERIIDKVDEELEML